MKRLVFVAAACLLCATPVHAHRDRLQRAYVATGGQLSAYLVESNGEMLPIGFKGLPARFGGFLRSKVAVPTLEQAGSVVATPNGRFLYVAGCAPTPPGYTGNAGSVEEIEAYRVGLAGVPREIAPPTQIEGCLTGNAPPYQTLAVSANGRRLFAAGGISYDIASGGSKDSIHVHAFRIEPTGQLLPAGDAQIAGLPDPTPYVALDSSGRWLFVAGLVMLRGGSGMLLAELRVGARGSLRLAAAIRFTDANEIAFNGLAASRNGPFLYASGTPLSGSALSTHLFGYRIAAGGALEPIPGAAADTHLIPTAQPNYESLALAPSGRRLYVMGTSTTARNGALIASYRVARNGTLRPSRGSTAATKRIARPQTIVLDATGRYLYEMDRAAGFMGGPAVLEFRTGARGAIVDNDACIGGAIAFCGRIPVRTGPIVIVR
ncbi:MAG: lactonase family protein [Firmicutes bacterium]|nr:lactonase family protein [Bacillota bacterium]